MQELHTLCDELNERGSRADYADGFAMTYWNTLRPRFRRDLDALRELAAALPDTPIPPRRPRRRTPALKAHRAVARARLRLRLLAGVDRESLAALADLPGRVLAELTS